MSRTYKAEDRKDRKASQDRRTARKAARQNDRTRDLPEWVTPVFHA